MSRAIHALATSLALSCIPAAAFAQAGCTPEHAAMGHCRMPAATAPSAPTPAAAQAPACTPEHAAMGHCTPAATGASAPREAIPAPTDADRAAAFAPLHAGHAHGAGIHSKIQFNRLETWDADPGSGQAWEGRAWFGGDLRRLWLRSEGERIGGSTHGADLEVLYGHATGPWWDLLAGLRHGNPPTG